MRQFGSFGGSINLTRVSSLSSYTINKQIEGITADRQTRAELLTVPMGAKSYVGWAVLYVASIYIYALCVLS